MLTVTATPTCVMIRTVRVGSDLTEFSWTDGIFKAESEQRGPSALKFNNWALRRQSVLLGVVMFPE